MEKKARDKMIDKINEGVLPTFNDGCDIDDKNCLINTIFSRINKDEIAQIKDLLFDDNILSILKDKDLLACVDEFFKYNLNLSETSRNAFLHRNTLIYRIDKIHKATGFNIKNFNDAVSFKILMMIYQVFLGEYE